MIITALLVLWLFGLLTAVTTKIFWDPVEIPGSTVTAYGILFGALALAVGLWQFRTKIIDSRRGITHDPSIDISATRQGAPMGEDGRGFPRWPGASTRDQRHGPAWDVEEGHW